MKQEKLNPIFYDDRGCLLPEFKKFNWGACIFGFIWGIFNKSYLTLFSLLLFIPVPLSFLLGLIFPIWFGIEGNRWAIENKEWENVEHFNKVQRIWATWAIIVTLMILIPFILLYILLVLWIIKNPGQMQDALTQFGLMSK